MFAGELRAVCGCRRVQRARVGIRGRCAWNELDQEPPVLRFGQMGILERTSPGTHFKADHGMRRAKLRSEQVEVVDRDAARFHAHDQASLTSNGAQ